MDFFEATEELRSFVMIEDIAKALGTAERDFRFMRKPTNSQKAISAPDGSF
jgi:hypothetical protein